MPRARAPQEEGARGSPGPLPKPALPIGSAGGERRGAEGRAPPVWERAGRAQGDALARLGRGEADMESGRPAGRPCWALGSAQLCKARPGQARPAAGRPREWGVVGDGEGSSHHLQAGPAWLAPMGEPGKGGTSLALTSALSTAPTCTPPHQHPQTGPARSLLLRAPKQCKQSGDGGCPQNPKTRIRPCWHGGRTVCVGGGVTGTEKKGAGCSRGARGQHPLPQPIASLQGARLGEGSREGGAPLPPFNPGPACKGGAARIAPQKLPRTLFPAFGTPGSHVVVASRGRRDTERERGGKRGWGWGSGSRALGGRSLGAGGAASRCSPGEGPPESRLVSKAS